MPWWCILRSCIMSPKHAPIDTRFWEKVDSTPGFGPNGDCWDWLAGKTVDGYGVIATKGSGRRMPAHRFSWEFHNAAEVPPGLVVCHTCDIPACCNPAHLWVGTHRDNALDREAKGRGGALWGEANPHCTISDAIVEAILREYIPGVYGYRRLAAKYGISKSRVGQIITWQGRSPPKPRS